MRRVVYVAHALSGTYAEMMNNRLMGSHWCAWLCRHFNVATIADWIVMSSVLEETSANRSMGLDCDLSLIERVDALLLVGLRVSEGMKLEALHAKKCGKPVIDLTGFGIRCPTAETRIDYVAEVLAIHGIERALAA